jgi:hypothetical protein
MILPARWRFSPGRPTEGAAFERKCYTASSLRYYDDRKAVSQREKRIVLRALQSVAARGLEFFSSIAWVAYGAVRLSFWQITLDRLD